MKKKTKSEVSPAGLYLWNVGLDNCNESLWVTTSKPSIVDASRKAIQALKHVRTYCPRAAIRTIAAHGTLDA